MTDIELLKGLDTEIPGWVLQSRLSERGYTNIWQKIEEFERQKKQFVMYFVN